MNDDDEQPLKQRGKSSKPVPARIESPERPQAVTVSIQTDTLNINASSLNALERLAEHSPEVAIKLIEATKHTVAHDSRKYIAAAICAGVVACVMLGCVTYVIATAGFWAGIALFLVCAAASAIFSAMFTHTSQSLEWTVGFLRGRQNGSDHDAGT